MDKPMDFTVPSQSSQGFDGAPKDISMEQMQWLLKNLSSADQAVVAEQMRNCTSEMLVKRGLPLAAVVMGSMYYARQRLPTQYHFGPKGWPFYALLGFGSVTLSTLLTTNTCASRLKPMLGQMYEKYSNAMSAGSATSYDTLRMANRARLSGGPIAADSVISDIPQPASPIQMRDFSSYTPSAADTVASRYKPTATDKSDADDYVPPHDPSALSTLSTKAGHRSEVNCGDGALGTNNWLGIATSGAADEEPLPMSGTPYRTRDSLDFLSATGSVPPPPADSLPATGKGRYGDTDFS